jgi:uncharacterized protein YjcR
MLGGMCSQFAHLRPETFDNTSQSAARSLYWQGWRISHIAKHLGIKRTTLQGWKRAQGWDSATPVQRVANSLEARMVQLIAKESKTGGDYKEIDLLGRQFERLARVNKYSESGRESDLNPAIHTRNEAPRKARGKRKNWFTEEQIDKLREAFMASLYGYQRVWFDNSTHRIRQILKSRQIGATWYFAREALMDAIDTGRNQIFISASKSQAQVFRQYIVQFVEDTIGVKLTGENIILGNGAELRFLGTNFRTAQSYHGNLYIDEYFWINSFEKLYKVARGMASHKQYRITLFSTPSAQSHEAYPYWTGAAVNKHRAKDQQVVIDLEAELIKTGFLGGDGVWRQRVTIEDAQAAGCDLFDIEQLRLENSPAEFENLYMCGFIDDSLSAFKFSDLQRCMVDADVQWLDYRRYTERPFGNKGVWVGHDPSYSGDSASVSVMAPPEAPGGDFRVLERQSFRGADFEKQAKAIEAITKKYNVEYLAIDVTGGWGQAVYDLVKKFYPRAVALNYSLDLKVRLVLKAQTVIQKARLKFDASDVDLARSFLSIRQTLTQSQKNITFETGRNALTGHGDAAWSVMHVLINEPLDAQTVTKRRKGKVSIH